MGQENSKKHLPGKYVTSDLRLHSVYIDCQCCYSVCKSDIDLVLDVHPVQRPARAYRNTSRAPRGRCLDPHVQVFLLDEHLGQGRYPIHIRQFAEKRYMNLTVIMFFSPSVFLCYVPAPYLLNDWKLIKEMSKARILVVDW